MIYKFKNVEIFYKYFKRRSEVVNIFMHGWGDNHKNLLFCGNFLSQSCLFVDFPPFGGSAKDIKDWTIFTYANMIISLCQHLDIRRFNLVGHSFGGRIAILIAVLCKNETNKIVLIDSAGLKPRRTLTYHLKVFAYKIKKKIGRDVSKYGSCDYLALNENMKKIFINVVNTHLDDFLPFIKCNTLIIFGKSDKVTPVYMAKKLHKKIKNSKLILYEDAGHFCFIDKKLEFIEDISHFLTN